MEKPPGAPPRAGTASNVPVARGRLIDLEIHTRGAPRPLLPCPYEFPDPHRAGDDGLIGYGADFRPETIIKAYRAGIFPWPHPAEERLWFSPDPRAIIPIGGLHIARRLARTIRASSFRVTLDAAFEDVMRNCAIRADDGTWITEALVEGYAALHHLGYAHSFEVWDESGQLVGGLYGVAVGSLFGAESMFHRVTGASKVAMVAMMEHAERIGLTLIDIQVLTPHTESMGGIEVTRDEYLEMVAAARAQVAWGG